MVASFARIRRVALSIHVFSSDGIANLVPYGFDLEYENSKHSVEGDGSRENPYTFESAVSFSPHRGIIDLWFRFHELTKQANPRIVFIEVNDWILQVGPEGVTSLDGYFTKFS